MNRITPSIMQASAPEFVPSRSPSISGTEHFTSPAPEVERTRRHQEIPPAAIISQSSQMGSHPAFTEPFNKYPGVWPNYGPHPPQYDYHQYPAMAYGAPQPYGAYNYQHAGMFLGGSQYGAPQFQPAMPFHNPSFPASQFQPAMPLHNPSFPASPSQPAMSFHSPPFPAAHNYFAPMSFVNPQYNHFHGPVPHPPPPPHHKYQAPNPGLPKTPSSQHPTPRPPRGRPAAETYSLSYFSSDPSALPTAAEKQRLNMTPERHAEILVPFDNNIFIRTAEGRKWYNFFHTREGRAWRGKERTLCKIKRNRVLKRALRAEEAARMEQEEQEETAQLQREEDERIRRETLLREVHRVAQQEAGINPLDLVRLRAESNARMAASAEADFRSLEESERGIEAERLRELVRLEEEEEGEEEEEVGMAQSTPATTPTDSPVVEKTELVDAEEAPLGISNQSD